MDEWGWMAEELFHYFERREATADAQLPTWKRRSAEFQLRAEWQLSDTGLVRQSGHARHVMSYREQTSGVAMAADALALAMQRPHSGQQNKKP